MASRQTMEEAQELKANFEQRHPTRTFRIKEKWTQYQVLEVRKCKCGAEVLTAAIGEDGLDKCADCQTTRQTRQANESQARAGRAARSRERGERFDRYWK